MPYASAGDVCLRHQMLILKDEGLLDGIAMTWPYNLGDLYYNLQASEYLDSSYSFVGDNLMQRALSESKIGYLNARAFVNAGTDSQPFRSFYSFSRSSFETGVGLSIMQSHYAVNLNTTYASNPDDGNHLRLDGSYVGVSFWNWTLAVDDVERWWGPGWEGSLILSNNARPFPAVSFSRNVSKPFDLPVLRWLGNWTFTTFMGKLVDDNHQDPANPYTWGMRIEIQPFEWFSLGFNRMAQWGGRGRPMDFSTFWKLISGRDNNGPSLSSKDEPGNQLAGIDWRLKPVKSIPATFYGQLIGEDAGGFMPTKLMFLGGLETWGIFAPIKDSTWRLHVEYADSAARYNLTSAPDDIYNFGYNHHIYKNGYRYKDLCLGHAMDGDGDMLSLGGLLCEDSGRYWGLLLRTTHLDRHNDVSYKNVHTVSRIKASVHSMEMYGGFDFLDFAVKWSLSYMDYDVPLIGITDHLQADVSVSYSY